MTDILHINDHCLMLQKQHHEIVARGCAWLTKKEVYFDEHEQRVASQHSRIHPQQCNSRYWQQCDESSIRQNSLGLRHSADLIWAQLNALKQQHSITELIVIVPPHYRLHQVQLLLGICKASYISVVAVINKATLYATHQAQGDGFWVHIDMQLHQVAISTVLIQSGTVSLKEVETHPKVSIESAYETLMHSMQKEFIDKSRFDPLHYAQTEQQLYDLIPSVLTELGQSGSTQIELQYNGTKHAILYDIKQARNSLVSIADELNKHIQNLKNIKLGIGISFNQASSIIFENTHAKHLEFIDRQHVISALPARDLSKENQTRVYYTQLASCSSLSKQEPVIADNGQSNVDTSNADEQENEQTVTHLLQHGKAYHILYSKIVFKERRIHIEQSSESNLLELLQEKQLFILGDETKAHIQPNDRIASNMADGVLHAISVLGFENS